MVFIAAIVLQESTETDTSSCWKEEKTYRKLEIGRGEARHIRAERIIYGPQNAHTEQLIREAFKMGGEWGPLNSQPVQA